MKRVLISLVPVETRSFKSEDFFIWLHHGTSCIPAYFVNVTRCMQPELSFMKEFQLYETSFNKASSP